MINKSCLACDCFRDDCVGSEPGCGKHTRIDFARPVSNVASSILTVIPSPVETRQQKFARIGKKRQEAALEAIRKLEHLTSRYYRQRTGVTTYTYEWTAEQAKDLLAPIEVALAELRIGLLTAPLQREHGLITEK